MGCRFYLSPKLQYHKNVIKEQNRKLFHKTPKGFANTLLHKYEIIYDTSCTYFEMDK